MGNQPAFQPPLVLSPTPYHGRDEEGGRDEGHEEVRHEGCSDEEGHEGEEGGQRDEEGSDEEGHEEGQGDRGGVRAEHGDRFQEVCAEHTMACHCGHSAGCGQGFVEAEGRMTSRASTSLCIVWLVRVGAASCRKALDGHPWSPGMCGP